MPRSMGKGREAIIKESKEKEEQRKKESEEKKIQKQKELEEKYTIIDGKKYVTIDGELKLYNTNNFKTTRLERLNEYGLVFNKIGGPKKYMKELINEYVKDGKQAELAGNTIFDLVEKDILKYRKAFDNMINFADFSVFKTVPHQVLRECETYGLAVQDYAKKNVEAMAGKEVMVFPVENVQCRKCKKYRDTKFFYSSHSDFSDGWSVLCKDCTIEMFLKILADTNDIKESLIAVLTKIDIPVDVDIIETLIIKYSADNMESKLREGYMIGDYVTRHTAKFTNFGYKGYDNSFIGSNFGGALFNNIYKMCEATTTPVCKQAKMSAEDEIEEEYNEMSKKKIGTLRAKWGNFDIEDLRTLENNYNRWINSCEIDGAPTEALILQICFEELNIFKSRQSGKSDMSKMIKTYQELLKSANLMPKQQNAISQNSEFASLGDLIKKVEQTKPIISRNKEYDDINDFEKQARVLAGCISRTLGKTNEYVKEFEEGFAEHTIDFDQMSGDGDGIE